MDVCVDQVQGIEPWIDLIARQAVYFIIGLVFETNQLPVCWYFTWLWRNIRFIVSRLGLEPRTHGLKIRCSSQLSYRDIFCCCGCGSTRTTSPKGNGFTVRAATNYRLHTRIWRKKHLLNVPTRTEISLHGLLTNWNTFIIRSHSCDIADDIISLKHVIHQQLWKRRNLMGGFSWTRTTFFGFSVRRIYHICQESMMLGVVTESNRQLRSHSAIC